MPVPLSPLILGESTRTIDDRYRLTLPADLAREIVASGSECLLAKEQPGCLSLWNAATWQAGIDEGVKLVESKIQAGRLSGRLDEVQLLGRLLSTRNMRVQLAGRGRLLIPEGFREFLGVEPGGTAMVVGAAVCVEIWHPRFWQEHIARQMPDFRKLIDQLVG